MHAIRTRRRKGTARGDKGGQERVVKWRINKRYERDFHETLKCLGDPISIYADSKT